MLFGAVQQIYFRSLVSHDRAPRFAVVWTPSPEETMPRLAYSFISTDVPLQMRISTKATSRRSVAKLGPTSLSVRGSKHPLQGVGATCRPASYEGVHINM